MKVYIPLHLKKCFVKSYERVENDLDFSMQNINHYKEAHLYFKHIFNELYWQFVLKKLIFKIRDKYEESLNTLCMAAR